MKRLIIVVEGDTEKEFVDKVLKQVDSIDLKSYDFEKDADLSHKSIL